MLRSVSVRTIRPHDTSEGLKLPGDVYDRTREDADTLSFAGVIEAAPATKPKARKS